MKAIKKSREARGFSQRELASRSGLSFRCIQQLEETGHNWRVGSLSRAARALMLPPGGLEYYSSRYISLPPDSVEECSLKMHLDGNDSWKIHLFDFIDRFRSQGDPKLIASPPVTDLDPKLRALITASVETLCDELANSIPPWCRGIPALAHPWFVSGIENLKAMAVVESPIHFRKRNIFVLGNFLERA